MCVDQFRRSKRRTKVSATESFDIFDVLESEDPNKEMSMMRDQTYDRVRTLVDMLPTEQREVVILRHYADMSFKEIACLTDVSINTALGRMRYALINIRKMIEEKELVI
jgi:RNA polymerase sigma-70 factor (ECF subfamily)